MRLPLTSLFPASGLYPTKSLSKLILITLYGAKNPSSMPCFKEYVYIGSPKY